MLEGVPPTVYFDSSSTVFVATSDTAIKKSMWLRRRVLVMTDSVKLGELAPKHIPEYNNVADMFTKYLKHSRWYKLSRYLLNQCLKAVRAVK